MVWHCEHFVLKILAPLAAIACDQMPWCLGLGGAREGLTGLGVSRPTGPLQRPLLRAPQSAQLAQTALKRAARASVPCGRDTSVRVHSHRAEGARTGGRRRAYPDRLRNKAQRCLATKSTLES
mmetsp:Transcript_26938/g.82931  ORF Transcript_26938/g.82931 Transcript_26938/m.82931 type:complete len:123 (-) Transcript_26938:151-519(-)